MGQIRKSSPVKLIIGFIYQDASVLNKAEALLKRKFGQIDLQTPQLPFNHTDYYKEEFSEPLKRKFIAFKKLIPAKKLPAIKIAACKMEARFSKDYRRLINIDPGYLDLAKLVLASTKDFVHRIYLDKGIYAEVTLFYKDKSFQAWDWTYPDYKTGEYIVFFNQLRKIYGQQFKNT